MNDTHPYENQPRVPGVKYAKETRYRQETTTIDGVSSTRNVPYDVLVPQPPRDWDEVILRGVTGLAMGITTLAVIGTTASVGGQLSEILHPVIAYGVGVVFTASWLACLGLEWVARTDPKQANPARIVGWITLVISMVAVFSYGYDHGQAVAGGVGACLDLLAKGLWALLIHTHRVPLSAGVSHWLHEQEQQVASRSLLSRKIARLNRNAAYQQAVGGHEYVAAGSILTSVEEAPALPGPDVSGQGVRPVPAQVQAPVASVPQAPVLPPSGLAGPVSGQGQAPVTPAPEAPVPPPSGQGEPEPGQAPGQGQAPDPQKPEQSVAQIGGSIAGAIRKLLAEDPQWQEDQHLDDLVKAVEAACGPRDKLAETVRRTRDRQLKKPKRTA